MKRLFIIAKKDLQFTVKEFLDSTFKEVAGLINKLNELESDNQNTTNSEGYIEKVVSIDEIPFL